MNTEAARIYSTLQAFRLPAQWDACGPWEIHPDCIGPTCSLWDAHAAARPVRVCVFYGTVNAKVAVV